MKAVVTGATKGIGWEIAKALVQANYRVAICARTEADVHSRKVALEALNPGVEIIAKPVDMSDKKAVQQFGQTVASQWGDLDVLVNNAGIFMPGQILEEVEGTLEAQMATNLYSAYYMTRALIDLLKAAPKANIINMCSIASFMAYPNGGSYSISKFAMLGFSKVLREELKPTQIKVTSIMPGATWSDSWAGADLPYERLVETVDIAKIVMNLLTLSPSAVVEEIIVRPQLGDL